ncbi:BspC domain-containing protein [Paraburkholderia sp.]|uniref:BspC domain-containing protein n=1 Tax=Paraburkholderia sp. TaxID=1926495 RepID=UPI003D6FDD1B
MDRTNTPRQFLRWVGRLAACAAGISLACATPAFADQLEEHNALVTRFINDMHADPLVADCAAHANFVASTSSAFDHVDFPPSSFDSSHASVTPWNDSFDDGKQRVKVDSVVTVEGLGIPQNGNGDPMDLKFRCGYVGTQMLAFSWNDPVPPARARASPGPSSGKKKALHGKHGVKKSTGKTSKSATAGKSASRSGTKAAPHTGARKTAKTQKAN